MPEQNFTILVFVLWFILPIIPAFVLYKFLPNNKVSATGPFQGLRVDLAGAFAGYFLLFLGSYLIVNKLLFDEKERFEVWTVKGTVQDEAGRALQRARNKPSVVLHPSIEIDNGIFDFPVSVRVKDGFYDFPIIIINASSADQHDLFIGGNDLRDFTDMDVDKSDAGKDGAWVYNFQRKTVRYKKALRLTKEESADTAAYTVIKKDSTSFEIDPKQ